MIVFDCCMLYLHGYGPVGAVGLRRPSSLIDTTIPMIEKSPPLLQPRLLCQAAATHCADPIPLAGVRNATIDSARVRPSKTAPMLPDGGQSHLTRDHHRKRCTYRMYFYIASMTMSPVAETRTMMSLPAMNPHHTPVYHP